MTTISSSPSSHFAHYSGPRDIPLSNHSHFTSVPVEASLFGSSFDYYPLDTWRSSFYLPVEHPPSPPLPDPGGTLPDRGPNGSLESLSYSMDKSTDCEEAFFLSPSPRSASFFSLSSTTPSSPVTLLPLASSPLHALPVPTTSTLPPPNRPLSPPLEDEEVPEEESDLVFPCSLHDEPIQPAGALTLEQPFAHVAVVEKPIVTPTPPPPTSVRRVAFSSVLETVYLFRSHDAPSTPPLSDEEAMHEENSCLATVSLHSLNFARELITNFSLSACLTDARCTAWERKSLHGSVHLGFAASLSASANKKQALVPFQNVKLDCIEFDKKDQTGQLVVAVRVRRLEGVPCFKAFVRVSRDGWTSWRDVEAYDALEAYKYSGQGISVHSEQILQARLSLHAGNAGGSSEVISFAVCYAAGGAEYWDNNHGRNFDVAVR